MRNVVDFSSVHYIIITSAKQSKKAVKVSVIYTSQSGSVIYNTSKNRPLSIHRHLALIFLFHTRPRYTWQD